MTLHIKHMLDVKNDLIEGKWNKLLVEIHEKFDILLNLKYYKIIVIYT